MQTEPLYLPGTLPRLLDGWVGPLVWTGNFVDFDFPRELRLNPKTAALCGHDPNGRILVNAEDERCWVERSAVRLDLRRPEAFDHALRWRARLLWPDCGDQRPGWMPFYVGGVAGYWALLLPDPTLRADTVVPALTGVTDSVLAFYSVAVNS